MNRMVVKIGGFGIFQYVRDRFNLFDGTIVILGITEFILVKTLEGEEGEDVAVFGVIKVFNFFCSVVLLASL